jgi:hypothetical protein
MLYLVNRSELDRDMVAANYASKSAAIKSSMGAFPIILVIAGVAGLAFPAASAIF